MVTRQPEYVLVLSGTFNPPHKGHVILGAHSAKIMIQSGNRVRKIIYVPVHDNYMVNKILGKPSANVMFIPMSKRVSSLQRMITDEPQCKEIEKKGIKQIVLPYENLNPQLLQTSAIWSQRLKEGYLKTISTSSLIESIGEEYAKKGLRVAAIFGADLLTYMPKWNNVDNIFKSADLVIIGRAIPRIDFAADPKKFLSNFHKVDVHFKLPVGFQNKTMFGDDLGSYDLKTRGPSRLFLLPPLPGKDENLSSSRLRKDISEFLQKMQTYGYPPSSVIEVLGFRGSWQTELRDAAKRNKSHFVQGGKGSSVESVLKDFFDREGKQDPASRL
ncbi:hypothetical protein AAMO2058_000529800 [Amorphochlora amoebiformis]